MKLTELLDAPREVLRTAAGRSLVLVVFASLLLLECVILIPAMVGARGETLARVAQSEVARVQALLETLSPQWAVGEFDHRPNLLGVRVEDASGQVAAQAGQADFSADLMQARGERQVSADGQVDVAFDVYRADGRFRAAVRVYTRPAHEQIRARELRALLLAVAALLLAMYLAVLVLRHQVLRPLMRQAREDSLTGLPNRTLFLERLGEVIAHCRQRGDKAVLMFIDLDRFKDFNDNFGHPQGDALLVELSRRLRNAMPADCMAARLGGDEFAVLIPCVQRPDEPREEAERVLEVLSRHYRYNQFKFLLSASIGVAILPEHGGDAASAQRNADIAMYVAKRSGRGRVVQFDAAMSEQIGRRKQVEDWLRHAIDGDELDVHYQPKIDIRSGRVVGAEALLRWTRGDGTALAPAEFIPVAEECGLIVPLGEWVMRRVLGQLATWRDAGFRAPRVAVNISANQFHDQDFLVTFLDTIGGAADLAASLDVEITESTLITSPEQAVRMLETIRGFGITVSLDDFGTGYSSLAYLKRFPVDVIKIDQSFVADLDDPGSARLVRALIGMTHNLDLLLVAEGVESAAQLERLRQWGCDQYQGHLASPAIKAEDFRAFCEANARSLA